MKMSLKADPIRPPAASTEAAGDDGTATPMAALAPETTNGPGPTQGSHRRHPDKTIAVPRPPRIGAEPDHPSPALPSTPPSGIGVDMIWRQAQHEDPGEDEHEELGPVLADRVRREPAARLDQGADRDGTRCGDGQTEVEPAQEDGTARELLDDDPTEPDPDRSAHLSPTLSGGRLDANLEPEAYHAAEAALRLAMGTKTDDDPRTITQRRHDALAEVFTHYLDHQTDRIGGRHRPHVNVTIGLDALTAGCGQGSFDDAAPITAADARRLACDANVHRVITRADGSVLDYGRATRTVSAALFMVRCRRDRGCRFPAATARPTRPTPITSATGSAPTADDEPRVPRTPRPSSERPQPPDPRTPVPARPAGRIGAPGRQGPWGTNR